MHSYGLYISLVMACIVTAYVVMACVFGATLRRVRLHVGRRLDLSAGMCAEGCAEVCVGM